MQPMIKEFEMSHLGNLSYFLGIEFVKTEKNYDTASKEVC